jgi:Putative addiction module component
MDRTFEQIRTEVLELDPESQRQLIDDVEVKLSESGMEFDAEWKREIKRRLDKHRRGEGTYVTAEESLAKGRTMIEEAKRKQK